MAHGSLLSMTTSTPERSMLRRPHRTGGVAFSSVGIQRATEAKTITRGIGGNLVVHELKQEKDGTLAATIPTTVDAAFTRPLPAKFSLQLGRVKIGGNQVELMAPNSFACAAAEMMPDRCKIEAQVQFGPPTRGCGIMLRTSEDLEASYYIRLEPQNQRMVFDSWPRVASKPLINVEGGYMAGLDRWLNLTPGIPVELKVVVDRTTAVVYASGGIAMSIRMYDLPTGHWGFFVDEGSAQIRNIRITALGCHQ